MNPKNGEDLAWCENRAKEALSRIKKAFDKQIRFDEGHVQRGGAGQGPKTPKPDITPKGQYESGQVVLTKKALSAIRHALEELPND